MSYQSCGHSPGNSIGLELTLITYDVQIGKTYRLVDDRIVTTVGGNGYKGRFHTIELNSMAELHALQERMTVHQCLIAGTSSADLEFGTLGEGYHDRRKEWFTEPAGAALVVCDIDLDGAPYRLPDVESVKQLFFTVVPQTRWAGMIIRPSSSNGIPGKLGGWHVHFVAPPGERLIVMDRLWAAFARAGYGWIKVSEFPALLERTPLDKALRTVHQPIFSARPIVDPAIRYNRPESYVQEGALFDPDWLKDDDPSFVFYELKRSSLVRDQFEEVLKRKAETIIPHDAPKRSEAIRKEVARLRQQAQEGAKGKLPPDFIITLVDGRRVTVREILANPELYDGVLTLTPGEEEYRDGAQTGIILGGRVLHTRAHGGITYTLCGDNRDFHIQQVLARVNAMNTITNEVTPEEAQARIKALVSGFLTGSDSIVIRATQGIGKTRTVAELLAAMPEGKRVLVLVPTLVNAEEIFKMYEEAGGERGIVRYGRNEINCQNWKALGEYTTRHGGKGLGRNFCHSQLSPCPFAASCKYYEDRESVAEYDIVFASHDFSHIALAGTTDGLDNWQPDYVIIDESLRHNGVSIVARTPTDAIIANNRAGLEGLLQASMERSMVLYGDAKAYGDNRQKIEILRAMIDGQKVYRSGTEYVLFELLPYRHINVPTLIIDGTADEAMVAIQYNKDFDFEYIDVKRNAIITQVVGNSFSEASLSNAETKASVAQQVAKLDKPGVGFVFTKKLRSALGKDEAENCMHFGNLRGKNGLANCNEIHVVGAMTAPPSAIKALSEFLSDCLSVPPPTKDSTKIEIQIPTRDGKLLDLEYYVSDHWIEAALLRIGRDAEVAQAADRARGTLHKGNPKQFYIWGHVNHGIPIDRVIEWKDFKMGREVSRLQAALDTGPIAKSASSAHLIRPDIWPYDGAAKADYARAPEGWMDGLIEDKMLLEGRQRPIAILRKA